MTEGTGRGWDRPGSRTRPDRRPSVTRRSRRKGGRSRGGRPRQVEAEPELAVAAAGAPVTGSSCPAKLSKAAQARMTPRCRSSSPFAVGDGRGAGGWSRARAIAAAAVARTRAVADADGRGEARRLRRSVGAVVPPNEVRGGGRGSPVLPAVQVSVRVVLGLPDQPTRRRRRHPAIRRGGRGGAAIPEYLIAEQRRGAAGSARRGRRAAVAVARAVSGGRTRRRSSVTLRPWRRGADQPLPDVSVDRRPAAVPAVAVPAVVAARSRGQPPRRDDRRPGRAFERSSRRAAERRQREPWSEVRGARAMLRAQLAQTAGRAGGPRRARPGRGSVEAAAPKRGLPPDEGCPAAEIAAAEAPVSRRADAAPPDEAAPAGEPRLSRGSGRGRRASARPGRRLPRR